VLDVVGVSALITFSFEGVGALSKHGEPFVGRSALDSRRLTDCHHDNNHQAGDR
jgi:hypothetical protein